MHNTSRRPSHLLPLIAAVIVPWFACSETFRSSRAEAGPLSTPIVGGRPVEHGEWPDVVAVVMRDNGLCTGTLLAADLVLTAAHCIEGEPIEVIVGSIDVSQPDGHRRAVKWARAYPSWEERYDVGLVMLENPVLAKQRAIVQGCTDREQFARGTQVDVVGFGLTTREATDRNTRLHTVTLDVLDPTCTTDAACIPYIAPGGEFTAGGNGRDACFGDSGGPVYLATEAGPALLGVVSRGLLSFGDPCGDGGVFVRADKVVAWIENVSGRKVDRVRCPVSDDGDGPAGSGDRPTDADRPDDEASGCSAGGGALHGGLAAYALVCIAALRRTRARRA